MTLADLLDREIEELVSKFNRHDELDVRRHYLLGRINGTQYIREQIRMTLFKEDATHLIPEKNSKRSELARYLLGRAW